jgi:hypothetical protein
MTLQDYVDRKAAKDGVRPGTVLRIIAEKSGMSKQALQMYYRGAKVGTAASAIKIAVAINKMGGGKVKPQTLMGFGPETQTMPDYNGVKIRET